MLNNLPPKMAKVTMHRAPLRLRECLEIRWFNNAKQEKNHA